MVRAYPGRRLVERNRGCRSGRWVGPTVPPLRRWSCRGLGKWVVPAQGRVRARAERGRGRCRRGRLPAGTRMGGNPSAGRPGPLAKRLRAALGHRGRSPARHWTRPRPLAERLRAALGHRGRSPAGPSDCRRGAEAAPGTGGARRWLGWFVGAIELQPSQSLGELQLASLSRRRGSPTPAALLWMLVEFERVRWAQVCQAGQIIELGGAGEAGG